MWDYRLTAFLEQPNMSLSKLLEILETFEYLSWFKIPISRTQIVKFDYIPSQEIKKSDTFNWKMGI